MKKEKELLRKQLELLAEQSKEATEEEIARLSSAMVDVYDRLVRSDLAFRCTLLFLVFFDLVASILILVK